MKNQRKYAKLFRQLTGKTEINVPKADPSLLPQGWQHSRTPFYWK